MPLIQTQKQDWQQELSNGVRSARDLLNALGLPLDEFSAIAEQDFATRVPWGFVARMRHGDRHDPLLKQVLPTLEEELEIKEFVLDPLQEKQANPHPGLLHKYEGRVLMIPTGQCAINCRYCFRRHFPYEANNPGQLGWAQPLRYISQDSSIEEVILSGGDPLLISDRSLTRFVDALNAIPHVKTLRFHTRLPIVLPSRMTTELIQLLKSSRLNIVIVLHCNHPQEIDDSVIQACHRLKSGGFTLLCQSVLLKGINDQSDILANLSQALFSAGVLPYYLHVLDKVQGAAHFDIPDDEAKQLHEQMKAKLPGYLVPRLVRETPGEPNKVWI